MDALAPELVGGTWDAGLVAEFVARFFPDAPEGVRAILCTVRNTVARNFGAPLVPWESYQMIQDTVESYQARHPSIDPCGLDAPLMPTSLNVDTMIEPLQRGTDALVDMRQNLEQHEDVLMSVCRDAMFDPRRATDMWGWIAMKNPARMIGLQMQRSVRLGWSRSYAISDLSGQLLMEFYNRHPAPLYVDTRAMAAHHYLMTLGDRAVNELHPYERGLLRLVLYGARQVRRRDVYDMMKSVEMDANLITEMTPASYCEMLMEAQLSTAMSLDVEEYMSMRNEDARRALLATALADDAEFVSQWYFILCTDADLTLALPTLDFPSVASPRAIATAHESKKAALARLLHMARMRDCRNRLPLSHHATAELFLSYQLGVDTGRASVRHHEAVRISDALYAVPLVATENGNVDENNEDAASRWNLAYGSSRELKHVVRRMDAVDTERAGPVVASLCSLAEKTGACEYLAALNRQTALLLFAAEDDGTEEMAGALRRKRKREAYDVKPRTHTTWWKHETVVPEGVVPRRERAGFGRKDAPDYFCPRVTSASVGARVRGRHGFDLIPTDARFERLSRGELPRAVLLQRSKTLYRTWTIVRKTDLETLETALPLARLVCTWDFGTCRLRDLVCESVSPDAWREIESAFDPSRAWAPRAPGEICPWCGVRATYISSCSCAYLRPERLVVP